MTPPSVLISVVIVSFNTRDLLRECLQALYREVGEIPVQILVVDNHSADGSAQMVRAEFPGVQLIASDCNLGFAAANDRAFPLCQGKYVVLLNSDAFLRPGALQVAIEHMESNPRAGLGGARLIGRDDSWQPSARQFPSLLNEFFSMTGLSAKFADSRLFGKQDRTWADDRVATRTDWVPGAFSIIPRSVLEKVGYFDEAFFLYYEEVDLCRRIKRAGYEIWYWPDIVVVHYGGESSKSIAGASLSKSGTQLLLWRIRSQFLYYRKHRGWTVWLVKKQEEVWHRLRRWRNALRGDPQSALKAQESLEIVGLLDSAWRETQGGRFSPQRPW